MRKLLAMATMLAVSLSPIVTAYGQSPSELRHDQIKSEQKAERDMAHGDYRAAKQHQRRASGQQGAAGRGTAATRTRAALSWA
jgi:hypothetical protein